MEFSITESYSVRPSDYEAYKFEVHVAASHRDVGISDDMLSTLGEVAFNQMRDDLVGLVKEQLDGEVQSRLNRATRFSTEDNNLAQRVLASRRMTDGDTTAPATNARRGVRRRGR